MDYEKAYKEAIKRAKSFRTPDNKDVAAYIFPELVESEDEKVRKELLLDIPKVFPHDKAFRYIAYLEKQGERKHQYKSRPRYVGEENLLGKKISNKKTADKVEPKFKIGDWAVTDFNNVVQIKVVDNSGYVLENRMRFSINYVDKCWHKWTIQDAKDGDVLATEDWVFIFKKINSYGKPICYCHYDIELGFRIDTNSYIATGSEIYPATKEQRDLLFQKMKETGYKWDAEKKELKKIEQKPAEWSEEDENLLKLSLENLTELKDRFGEEYGKVGDCIVWFKSLKQRYTWKPSGEQMNGLKEAIEFLGCTKTRREQLQTLYEQLKKL